MLDSGAYNSLGLLRMSIYSSDRSGTGLVDSVDDLKSSRSIRGTPGTDFELLDAKIASALNKIKVSLEEMKAPNRGPFPS